jgi:diketogulonate reductase-like aldo/keto reductase
MRITPSGLCACCVHTHSRASILARAHTHAPLHTHTHTQVEAHPYWRNDKLFNWASSKGIHVTAYSPLGSPDSAAIMKRSADAPSPLKDPVVQRVAEKLGCSPAQVGVLHSPC